MNQQVATQDKPTRAIDQFKTSLQLAEPTLRKMIPAHIPYDRFQAQLVTAVAYNPRLLECTSSSLVRAAAECVSIGLSLSPTMKEADILPVWGKDGTEAQFRPRYIGLMKLARQSGEIASIYSHEVYERDEFDYAYGLDKRLHHKPATGDRGKIIAAYCVWQTKDGTKEFEVVDEKRIERAKNASEGLKAYKNGKIKSTPWVTDEGEMTRKTAVHAAAKYFPRSTESDAFLRALHADETHEIEGAPTPPDDLEQISAPRTDAGASQIKSLEEKIGAEEPKDWKAEYAALAKELTAQDGGTWERWLMNTEERRDALKAGDEALGKKLAAMIEGKNAALTKAQG